MTEAKCTFGVKHPINIHMLNEIIYREVKHFRPYKIYRPNFGSVPLTAKFYASHDHMKHDTEEQAKRVEDYAFHVTQSRSKGPKCKYSEPMTNNQEYGWYSEPLVRIDRKDYRYYKPQKMSPETRVEVMILVANPSRKKKETGFIMKEGKCTFGAKLPIDIHMLNEIIYREVKHFRPYKIYRPNFGSIPLTAKFYASHDIMKDISKEQAEKVESYAFHVTQSRSKGPKSKYSDPVTDNQVYGWYSTPLVRMNRTDYRFYKPKTESPQTKVEIMIMMSNPEKKKKK